MTMKELREELSMSQKEFSIFYDIPLQTLRRWELGSSKTPSYVINMITKILEQTSRGKEVITENISEEVTANAVTDEAKDVTMDVTEDTTKVIVNDGSTANVQANNIMMLKIISTLNHLATLSQNAIINFNNINDSNATKRLLYDPSKELKNGS